MTFAELAEAMRTMDRSRRIVICEAGGRLQVETMVLRYGMDQLWTVRESPRCPAGKIILINDPGKKRS